MEDYLNKTREANLDGTGAKPVSSFTNKTYVKVFLYFGLALLITTAVTFGASSLIYNLAINNPEIGIMAYYIFLGVGMVGLVICSLIVSFFCNKKGRGLIVPYVLYAVFMGFILTGVCFTVDSPYVFGTALGFTALIFLITCGIGALLGDKIKFVYLVLIYGLCAIGFMCLFNFVLLPFIFMNSSIAINAFNALLWGIEIIYFVVIIAYIAIDMSRLKAIDNSSNGVITTNLALYCALNLFSDFIILFLRILYIVAMSSGKRKR